MFIPTTLRQEMLNVVHQGHLGQEKCLLRARTSKYWRGITNDIINAVKSVTPANDIRTCSRKSRLSSLNPQVTLGQFSKFPIIRKLSSTNSPAIISQLKSIFAEHRNPAQLVTDNGPQHSAQDFKNFTTSYGIEHITSSPLYPQSNGFSESMVLTIKNILEKCHEEGGDPYLGVLSYRATPVDHHLKSPAELLTHRKFKTLLLMAHRENLTADSVQVKDQLQRQQKPV